MILKMKQLQKIIALLAVASYLITSHVTFAYNTIYHTYSDTSIIAPGVTLTSEQRMTDVGWFNLNMIKMDLTNPSVKSTVLLPESISNKSTLLNLANSETDVVAAINGDFFDTQGKSTLGMVVKDGEYITSSIHDDRFYTYLQLKNGRSYIAKVLGESTKLTKAGFSLDITYKNKPYLQYDRAIVFDRNWGNASIGNTNSEPVIEVVVADNTIISMALDPPPQRIPENGYIVSAVGTLIPDIFANFQVGDVVELTDGGFLSHIDQAIGGGAKILDDGQPVTDFSLNISGRHPRSALGFSEDNKTLFLVTIDGRNKNFTGMTQTELAYLMAEAGAYNAINLDGGGSSELVAKPLGEENIKIINTPSEGIERRIHNGIGIKNTAPKESLDKILINLEQKTFFTNSRITPSLSGIDQNYHPVTVDKSSIQWTVSGVSAQIEGNVIIPLESGKMTLTAQSTIGSKTAMGSIEIDVIGTPERISVAPQTARLMPGNALDISLIGYDSNGFSAPLNINDVRIMQTGLKGTLVDSKYTVTESGSGYVRFSLGDADAFMSIGAGESVVSVHDFESKQAEFVGYPESVIGGYNITQFSHSGNYGGTLKYDFNRGTNTRAAYAKFGEEGLILPDNTSKLSLWVFGDYANNHWLRGKITDRSGETHTIDFSKSVNWKGWNQVTAQIPSDIEVKSLDRLYLVETDPAIKDVGVIVFDDLEAVVTAAPPSDLAAMSASKFEFESLDPTTASLTASIGTDALKVLGHNENIRIIELTNNNRGLSRAKDLVTEDTSESNGSRGWTDLLDYLPSNQTEQTLIFLSEPYGFKNPYDDALFKDTLNKLRTDFDNTVSVVSPGNADTINLIDGIWFITYIAEDNVELIVEAQHNSIKVGKQTVLTFEANTEVID